MKIFLTIIAAINFTILMPFTSGTKQDSNNLDFYAGALMAAKKYGDAGMDIRIRTLDFKGSIPSFKSDTDSTCFIIGPMKCEDIHAVIDSVDISTPVISPLDSKAAEIALTHTNMVEAATQLQDQYRAALEWAREETDSRWNVNYIIVTSEYDASLLRTVETLMNEYGLRYKVCTCGVQDEISHWDKYSVPADAGVNVAILAINNEAVLNNAVRNMSIYAKDGNTLVFTGSKIRSYETIPVECMHKARLHVLCPYFIDYRDRETKTFIHGYRALYHMEPSQYAYQGYDLTCHMIRTYAEYGKDWMEKIVMEPVSDMLQTSFKLSRIENGGLKNTAIRRVLYDEDYKIKLIKQ